MKLTNTFKRSRGVTLVELGIVIAIGATILAIVMKGVPALLADNRANAEIGELPAVITKIQRQYNSAPSYASVTLSDAVSLNAFPAERVVNATTVTNRWGGTVQLTPTTLNTPDDALTLTSSSVPDAECKSVIPAIANIMRTITVGSTNVKPDGAQVNLRAVGASCTSANNSNTIAYTFGK